MGEFCLFVSLMLEFGLLCPRFMGLVCFEVCSSLLVVPLRWILFWAVASAPMF